MKETLLQLQDRIATLASNGVIDHGTYNSLMPLVDEAIRKLETGAVIKHIIAPDAYAEVDLLDKQLHGLLETVTRLEEKGIKINS